ncbi:DUF5793 family protein [Halovenus salina]|uniref:DUF5793 family protein n=1 Tax=Halovenus salina TaxID=1510225 RepID=A0ABD5W503_9EURY|nr:DUF5793 family protein [Halovenus salina]
MRRDNFTVTVELPDADPDRPTLHIEYTGPTVTLTTQLTAEDGDLYPAEEIDAAFRLQDPLDVADSAGVFSLTHRVTGEYLLEVNVSAETVLDLVDVARDADGEAGSYLVCIEREDDPIEHEMDALFVYDSQGDLLRQHSLIPSGVEL